MDDIKVLINELQKSEEERDNLTVRNYQGEIFPIKSGILVYSKGLEVKVVLTEDKKLFYYLAKNQEVRETEICPEDLLNEVGFEKIYHNIQELLKEKIRNNKEEIMQYKNQESRIKKYDNDLDNDLMN